MIPPRVHMAMNAMKAIGVPPQTVKPVLKRLLKTFDNNWELIEDENYRVLADAIFDFDDTKRAEEEKRVEEKKNEPLVNDASEPSSTRRRLRQEEGQSLPSIRAGVVFAESSTKRPKFDDTISSQTCLEQQKVQLPQPSVSGKNTELISTQAFVTDKRTESVSQQTSQRPMSKKVSNNHLKEPKIEPGIELLPKHVPDHCQSDTLIKPKTEPSTDDFLQEEIPTTMVPHPPTRNPTRKNARKDLPNKDGSSFRDSAGKAVSLEAPPLQYVGPLNEDGGVPETACNGGTNLGLISVPEVSAATFEIASSTLGEVKLSVTWNSALCRSDFHAQNLDEVLKLVEDKYIKLYKIVEPTFALKKLMQEFCQCFLELGADCNNDKQETHVNITPTLDLLKESNVKNILSTKINCNFNLPTNSSNGSPNLHYVSAVAAQVPRSLSQNVLDDLCCCGQPCQKVSMISNGEWEKKREIEGSESLVINSHCLVAIEKPQFFFDNVKPLHDVKDITKGQEGIRISVVNELTSEQYPPSFYYIPRNIVYQNAYINFSLARIGDEDCCSDCFGDCLSSSIPCACARETGGEYAYTLDGRLKKEFLDECISMNRDPQKNRLFYCNDCPLERTKNELQPELCKGHLVRKFVKECWSKCGCSKQCGNRVVQRGITCNLQVFLTSEGKGWGLRTLEDLPGGTFVCEYVGEILTNAELYERTIQKTRNARHTYPVLLDADWGSEGVLKDEEALCLDATFYGNVGRFINHRCSDGNLIEIPVEIESPDHHYYHIAFFTTRNVQALEELTWDYGIDFDDHDHPVKAFKCCCGSQFCRDLKRPRRNKSSALILR